MNPGFGITISSDCLQGKVAGNREALGQLASTLANFELGFEILPGTKSPSPPEVAKMGPFEQDLRQINE
jgi:hypothetical protein